MSKQGKVAIVSGPSGCGKSTICRLLRRHPRVWMSVSATTRPKRPGEKEGKDYYFLDRDTFQLWIQKGRFLEYAQILDHFYGTPLEPVLEEVKKGKIVLLDIDIQGHKQVIEKLKDHPEIPVISIFILPPSMEVLEKRLRNRKTEKEEEIQKRLKRAEQEIQKAKEYDHQVVNQDLKTAVEEVCRILEIPLGKWLKLPEVLPSS